MSDRMMSENVRSSADHASMGLTLRRDVPSTDGSGAKAAASTGDELWPGFDAEAANMIRGRRTVGESVLELLRGAILAGALAPGRRLKQEELAKAVGVSRIPIRSALMQLESEGLVLFHPNRGAVVRSLTADQLREIFEIREVLETFALRKSFQAMTPERVRALRALAHKLDVEEEGPRFIDLRTEFYHALYNADDSPQLVKLIDDMRARVGRYVLQRRLIEARHGDSSHSVLVECAARGDSDRAESVLRDHLRAIGQEMADIGAQASEID